MTSRRPRRSARGVAGAALILAGLTGGALWTVAAAKMTTRQGVNFQVSEKQMPLYAKAIAFLHRDIQYRLLAREITAGVRGEPERVRAIFMWTRTHIQPTPKEWTVVDDHVLNIIIRGHGLGDQMADVFTTLTTYAGMPGFWRPGPVVFSFVRVEGRWAVFDVANGVSFTDGSGQFLDAEELLRHPEHAQAIAGPGTPGGVPYRWHVERLGAFQVPEVLRAEQQMPWHRLVFEVRRALRLILRSDARPAPSRSCRNQTSLTANRGQEKPCQDRRC